MATYDLTSTIPNKIKTGDILNCPYSGTYKTISLPAGIYKLEVWGAMGGYRSSTSYAGKGGYSYGTLILTDKTTTVYLYAGGAGNTSTTYVATSVYAGGFNGGGNRYLYKGGGGGSDVRIGSTSLYARVIVAGGGGSDGSSTKTGMYGGGTSGGSSVENYTYDSTSCGKGGTQTYSGYSASYTTTTQDTTGTTSSGYYGGFGFGGSGLYRASGYGGAGGGGWYGGSGTYPDASGDDDRGGGGGSGYVYTSSTASNYPSGCLLNSSYYLSDAATVAGNTSFTSPTGTSETGHADNGYVRITVIEAQSGPDNLWVKDSANNSNLRESWLWNGGQLESSQIPTGAYGCKMKIKINSLGTWQCLFCGGRAAAIDTDANSNTMFLTGDGTFRRDYYGSTATSTKKYAVGDVITVETIGGKTWINGELFTDFTTVSTASLYNWYFGKSYVYTNSTVGTLDNPALFDVYYIKIYKSGNTVYREYRPYNNGSTTGLWSMTANSAVTGTSTYTVSDTVYNPWKSVTSGWIKTSDPVQSEYEEFEYVYLDSIATSGTVPSIHTGVLLDSATKIRVVCDFELPASFSSVLSVFGAEDSTNRVWPITLYMGSATTLSTYVGSTAAAITTNVTAGQRIKCDITASTEDHICTQTINGVTTTVSFTGDFTTGQEFYVLSNNATDSSKTIQQQAKGVKLHSFKLYVDDILVKDYYFLNGVTNNSIYIYNAVSSNKELLDNDYYAADTARIYWKEISDTGVRFSSDAWSMNGGG